MTDKSEYLEMFWPFSVYKGQRIINEKGEVETIYKILNYFNDRNYVLTINNDNRKDVILRTYFVNGKGKNVLIKKIAEEKKNLLENLSYTGLKNIEKKLGLNALAGQIN